MNSRSTTISKSNSSRISRTIPSTGVSPASSFPPGNSHFPASNRLDANRCAIKIKSSRRIIAAVTTTGTTTNLHPDYLSNPTYFNDTSHNRAATSILYDSSDDRTTAHFAKYSPVTPSTSGELATYTTVRAPSSADFPNILNPTRYNHGASRARFVRVNPGCTQFTVTPDPSSLLASNRLHKITASFA